jgi:hypothetical protein
MRLQNKCIETATGGMGEAVNNRPFSHSPFSPIPLNIFANLFSISILQIPYRYNFRFSAYNSLNSASSKLIRALVQVTCAPPSLTVGFALVTGGLALLTGGHVLMTEGHAFVI